MMKNIVATIKGRLTTGLALMSILIVLSGVLSITFVNQLEGQLNTLSDNVVPTIETTDDLIANLWESAKVANEILASEDIAELKARAEEIKNLAVTFENNRIELLKVVTVPDHVTLIEKASAEQAEFVEHSISMSEQKLIELEKEIISERLLDEFDERGAELFVMLEEFATENEAEMQKAEDDGDLLVSEGADASAVNDVLGELFEKDYPVVEAALKLQRLILEMQDTSGEYLAEENPELLPNIQNEFLALSEQSKEYFTVLTELAESEEDKQDAKILIETFNAWVTGAQGDDALFDSYRDQLKAEAMADELTELLETDADNADASLEEVAAAADAISDSADETAAEVVSSALFGIIVLTLVAVSVGILVLWIAFKTVLQPIDNLLVRMKDIAEGEGDLTQRVDDSSSDELGQLANAFNRFVSKVQGVVNQIADATEEIVSSTERQKSISIKSREDIAQQRIETDSVATAIGGIADNAKNVSSSAAKAARSSDEANQETERTKSVVRESINSVQGLAAEVDKSSQVISSLNNDIVNINKVVDVIGGIAEQTNLLALNAAIEAARAGEQGRGFAVVADEVRSLASRTQESTAEINEMIDKLQRGSQGAVDAMEQSKKFGDASVSASEEAGRSLDIVSGSISTINDMNATIATAAEGQTVTMQELSKSVDSIVMISQQSMSAAEDSEKVSQELAGLGEKLKVSVNQFKY